MKIIDEFKKFALRGNMIDLAIGFTVGAAFTSMVRSLVDDIIMPPIGLILGDTDFSDKFFVLDVPDGVNIPEAGFQTLKDAQAAGAVTLNYGLFLNNCLTLFIVAVAMFLVIRGVNRLESQLDEVMGEKPPEASEPKDKKCEYCRSVIPYRASRCPQCTSELTPPPEATAAPTNMEATPE